MVKRVKKAFRATIFTLPLQSYPYKLPLESEPKIHTDLYTLDSGRGVHTTFHNIQQIGIIKRLLLICHNHKTIISNLQLFSIQTMTKLAQASIQTMPSRMFPHNQLCLRPAHRLRSHNLIGETILEHAILMNTSLVRKG